MMSRFFRVRDKVIEVRGRLNEGVIRLEHPISRVWAVSQGGKRVVLVEGHTRTLLWVVQDQNGDIWVSFRGEVFRLEPAPPRSHQTGGERPEEITSPLTGKVQKIHVREGDQVEEGVSLVTVEAMKMEYHLTAPAPATVRAILVKEGDLVDLGQVLVRLSYPPPDHLQPGGEGGRLAEE